jgi:flagellar hook-basal body protein
MSYIGIILQANTSMKAYSGGIEVIGENTSNANTPGYQAKNATFSEVYGESGSVGVEVDSSHLNQGKGDSQQTGNPLDLYVDGEGYFLTKNGNDYFLTRAGMFSVGNDGYLTDSNSGNEVVLLDANGGQMSVSIADLKDYDHVQTTSASLIGVLNSDIAINETYPAEDATPISLELIDQHGDKYTLHAEFTKSLNGKWIVDLKDEMGFVVSSNNEIYFDDNGEIRDEFSTLNIQYDPTVQLEGDNSKLLNDANFSIGDEVFELPIEDGIAIPLYVDGELVLSSSPSLKFQDGKFIDSVTNGELILKDAQNNNITDFTSYQEKQALPTTSISLIGNLDEAVVVGDSISENAGLPIKADAIQVDGTTLEVEFSFERIDTLEWQLSLLDSNGDAVTGNRTITFLSDGSISPFSRRFTFDIDQGNGVVQTIEVVLDDSNGSALQQSALAADISVDKTDGEEAASLVSVLFKEDTSIIFEYSDGSEIDSMKLLLLEKKFEETQTLAVSLKSEEGSLEISGGSPSQLSFSDTDGISKGVINDIIIDNDGAYTVKYSNGKDNILGYVALASVSDEGAISYDSGTKIQVLDMSGLDISIASDNDFTNIVSGYIELSNVDISDEFTKMVLLQRGYQASSHVVSVANSMLDDLYKAIE